MPYMILVKVICYVNSFLTFTKHISKFHKDHDRHTLINFRSQTDQAIFALNQINIGGNVVLLQKYDPRQDPQFYSNPAYQRLGQYIGKDYHVMNPNHFQPWSGTNGHSNMRQALRFTRTSFRVF